MSTSPIRDGDRYAGAPAAHVEALELLARLLGELAVDAPPDAFYNRLCEAICQLTQMTRAVFFHYDAARRRVVAAGTHGIELERFADLHPSVESAVIAGRALAEDRVLESTGGFEGDLPASWTAFVRDLHLVWIPMVAAGRWVGVVLCERSPDGGPLAPGEPNLLWMLGKMIALASVSRAATAQAERAKQLEQRIDLAREIHDGVVQRLFGVSLVLSGEVRVTGEAQRRCAEEVQSALSELRAALQRPLGRTSRASSVTLTDELSRLTERHRDLGVVLVRGDPASVPAELQALAQSVLVEAIRNASKHAAPTRVEVAIDHTGEAFVLEVTNDGMGEPVHPRQPSGMGLRLAGLEALQFGGVVEFGRTHTGRWQVRLVVPDSPTSPA